MKSAKASANDDDPMGLCHGSHGLFHRYEGMLSKIASPVILRFNPDEETNRPG
jgi:hypothetical protein